MAMNVNQDRSPPSFHHLYPDDVILLAEKSFGRDFTNLFRPLNSYINRVFELEDSQGQGIIIKFYRPGRWSKEAIFEEHQFLLELQQHEIPVIAPLFLENGESLGKWQGCHFAFFPKCGGRSVDEFNEEQWHSLGRLVGRVHAVGATALASTRKVLSPTAVTVEHIRYLRENNLVHIELQKEFFTVVDQLVEKIGPLFSNLHFQRIHGDLHLSNIIYRPGESFYLIDFDDMVMGPQVQDIWMLLTNYGEESLDELDLFLEGYEAFHGFDRRTCRLIEPLRALRYIHYLAWCGYQVVEDGETLVIPDYGSYTFWYNELQDFHDQLDRIQKQQGLFTFF